MKEDSYKRNLIEYIKKNLNKGYTVETLKWALINQGYLKPAVENAIEQAHKELAEMAPILKEKPKIKYEIIDEYNQPVILKKSFWRKIKDMFI
ncbi:MAG: hypothetical protein ACE5ES_00630 [Candidatus Nanoarchaeia archaeon]